MQPVVPENNLFLGARIVPDRQLLDRPRVAWLPAVHVWNPRQAGISHAPLHVLGDAAPHDCFVKEIAVRFEAPLAGNLVVQAFEFRCWGRWGKDTLAPVGDPRQLEGVDLTSQELQHIQLPQPLKLADGQFIGLHSENGTPMNLGFTFTSSFPSQRSGYWSGTYSAFEENTTEGCQDLVLTRRFESTPSWWVSIEV